MGSKSRIVIGSAVVALGVLLLIGSLLQINIWSYLWPLILIGIGAWVLMRPRGFGGRGFTDFMLLGDHRRRGKWQVKDANIFCLIGDITLDMTDADIPMGETTIGLQGFVGAVRVRLPEDVGISISSTAFLTDAHVLGNKQDFLLAPYEYRSEGYAEASRRVHFELLHFVTDLNVRRSEPPTQA